MRQLRPREIQHERPIDDGHLDRKQPIIRINQSRNVVIGDACRSFGLQNTANFQLTLKSVAPVEELDGADSIRAPDEAVLPGPRPDWAEQITVVLGTVSIDSRINHAPLC
jgi:hypothetical protein